MRFNTRWPLVSILALLSVASSSSQTTDKDKTKKQTPPPKSVSNPSSGQQSKPETKQEAPREERPYQAPRQDPGQQSRPEKKQETPREGRPYKAPSQVQPRNEQPRQSNANATSSREYRPSGGVYHPSDAEYHPAASASEYHQTAPLRENEHRYNLGANHPGTRVVTPPESPAFRRARVYNTRFNGQHISPDYFAANFGSSHEFHFPAASPPYFVLYQGEWYCQVNGVTFGVMGVVPPAWNVAYDNLHIDIGDDGNYYLYDTNQPDLAIQLTFVQAKGDDQAD
jgi:hypothetical protein